MFTSEQLSGGNVTVDGVSCDIDVKLTKKTDTMIGKNDELTNVGGLPYSYDSNGNWFHNVVDLFAVDAKNKYVYAGLLYHDSNYSHQNIYINTLNGKGWQTTESLNAGVAFGNFNEDIFLIVDGKLHTFFCNFHHIYDPVANTWTSMPSTKLSSGKYSNINSGSATYYDGKIHATSMVSSKMKHFIWDGTTWSESNVSLPEDNGKIFAYKNDLLYLVGTTTYKFTGSAWVQTDSVTNFSMTYNSGMICEYDNKIYTCYCDMTKNESNSYYTIKYIVNIYNGESIDVKEIIYSTGCSSTYKYEQNVRRFFVIDGDMYFITDIYNIYKYGDPQEVCYGYAFPKLPYWRKVSVTLNVTS